MIRAAVLTLALAAATFPARAVAEKGRDATLQVFAAASLSDAFAEIGKKLEQRRPGTSPCGGTTIRRTAGQSKTRWPTH